MVIWKQTQLNVSDELEDYINECFEKGCSTHLSIYDIAEWAEGEKKTELVKTIDELISVNGEFYMKRNLE